MPEHFNPEDFDIISVEDALAHPSFDPHLRHVVLAVNERGGDLTVAEIAEVIGLDPIDLARRIIGEAVLAEVRRIAAEDAARGRMN
ncbi:MAG: hypothetical protein WBF99_01240 [Xanthobacteraceae bacterium]